MLKNQQKKQNSLIFPLSHSATINIADNTLSFVIEISATTTRDLCSTRLRLICLGFVVVVVVVVVVVKSNESVLRNMNNTVCLDMNTELWRNKRDWSTQSSTTLIFAFFYTTIILIGVAGNLCVILAISRTRALQTVPNMFIFSLSCSDLVVCFTSATVTPIAAFSKEWIFGAVLCSIAPFIAVSFIVPCKN
ncbi:unnamed protein product [Litomosoides sigmodontis]|uniref:G-protein coupled receptors family 1 profile domain-containing protein n=1 Tax=Litomosoides sigmodontis TaxID=42156 RepID=A0A3P6SIW5_LITSI|nr:unnamed protein product [Litomosoides sigmodontis]